MTLRWPEPIFGGVAVVALILVIVASIALSGKVRPLREAETRLRLRVWWTILLGFVVALMFDRIWSVVALGLVSFVAFKEFVTLAPTRRADVQVLLWAYLAIPLQYMLVAEGAYGLFVVFIPVYAFMLLPMRMVLTGETHGFLQAVGVIHWGLMTTVFSISHLAYLVMLPDLPGHKHTGLGLLFFLVVLTQLNDVAQQVINRRFGRRAILETVRPGLTAEGFAGGIVVTALCAMALAKFYTPFTVAQAAVAGASIGLFGVIGFVVITMVERDLGVRESSHFLPGHGGLLGRLDSLIFTAPLFFHITHNLYYG